MTNRIDQASKFVYNPSCSLHLNWILLNTITVQHDDVQDTYRKLSNIPMIRNLTLYCKFRELHSNSHSYENQIRPDGQTQFGWNQHPK